MNYEIVNLEEKVIVGLTARTGNTNPDIQKIVGGLWQDFMGKGISDSLKNKANPYCVGLYTNYNFEDVTYDVTVGAEVSQNANPELSYKIIPAGKYAKFNIKGDVVRDVSNAWNEIWEMPLERTYTADFEEYLSNENGVADINIYIALK
ncbi:MAG TPA: GyrI-like domain-containing protein [Oscillospiraceae bacterium]|nr:GyrI-like domain-containing protein [Oscillospiraceae bacterium]